MFNYPDFAINSAGGQANAYESEALPEIIGRISESMPDRYQDMFPEARKLKRHFIVHIGPTNSGKTHDAISAFMAAGKGAYLAPLRLALITVLGNEYVLLDICLRMLTPEELKLGQGFPKDYIIDRDYRWRKYPVSKQVARIGNSVVPIMAEKLVLANCPYLKLGERLPAMSVVSEENGQLKFA